MTADEAAAWDEHAHGGMAMLTAMWCKFQADTRSRAALLATGHRPLVEAALDARWGAGTLDRAAIREGRFSGENRMGRCLEHIRWLIRNPSVFGVFPEWEHSDDGGRTWGGRQTAREARRVCGEAAALGPGGDLWARLRWRPYSRVAASSQHGREPPPGWFEGRSGAAYT